MKILIANDCDAAPLYIRLGLGNALTACGHDVVVWDIRKKCAFDAFSEFEPDIFLGQTYNVNPAVSKCIKARPQMKVALFASAYGEIARTIDKKRFPIDVATDNELKILDDLYKTCQKPDLVHIHCPDRFVDLVLGDWRKNLGLHTIGLMNGADIFSYLGGKSKPEYYCDAAFVGGFWGYKGENIRRLLLPVCHDLNYQVKIFGNSHWGLANYLGPIVEEDVKDLFASATLCPNISEPHSIEYGYDIVERVFKVPLSGFVVCDDVSGVTTDVFTNGECPIFKSAEELKELIECFRKQLSLMMPNMLQLKQKRTILAGHTYFHRAAKLMGELGLPEQEKAVLVSYKQIMDQINENSILRSNNG